MWHFLVGHRGVGKSSLLKRLRTYGNVLALDLDDEIESRESLSIKEIFSTQGESYFRRLEETTLLKLWHENSGFKGDVYVSVGAGFQGAFPEPSRVIWVRRPTDLDGRIFLDRPRLNPGVGPHQEYLSRAREREPRYQQVADEVFELAEGFDTPSEAEKIWFGFKSGDIGGYRTLLRWDFRRPRDLKLWWHKRSLWGLSGVEVRNDFFTDSEVDQIIEVLGRKNILYSIRREPKIRPSLQAGSMDWALELGSPPLNLEPQVLSWHGENPPDSYSGNFILKWSPVIGSWSKLLQAHKWWLEDVENRSLLPRSSDGRWMWYRQIFGPKMPLAFWREGQGSAIDQPSFFEWTRNLGRKSQFAAVLGDPVHHSLTPSEQDEFFASLNMPVVAIRVTESEIDEGALGVLGEIGLRAAAVTAPLKKRVFKQIRERSDLSLSFEAVNTLIWNDSNREFRGTNTDLAGARALLGKWQKSGDLVAVWGGGGVKDVVNEVLPDAQFFSVRMAQDQNRRSASSIQPQVVVWCIGRSRIQGPESFPPLEWRPHTVVDLNYASDSPAREWALEISADYVSGLEMFKVQAAAQREFWSSGPGFCD